MFRKPIIVVLMITAVGMAIIGLSSAQVRSPWLSVVPGRGWVRFDFEKGRLALHLWSIWGSARPASDKTVGRGTIELHGFTAATTTSHIQVATVRAPAWLLALLLMTYPACDFIRGPLRRRRRRRRGFCLKCGYDLTGNESGVCPECGAGTKRT